MGELYWPNFVRIVPTLAGRGWQEDWVEVRMGVFLGCGTRKDQGMRWQDHHQQCTSYPNPPPGILVGFLDLGQPSRWCRSKTNIIGTDGALLRARGKKYPLATQ